jgi:hypothetical protein
MDIDQTLYLSRTTQCELSIPLAPSLRTARMTSWLKLALSVLSLPEVAEVATEAIVVPLEVTAKLAASESSRV